MNTKTPKKPQHRWRWLTYDEALTLAHEGKTVELVYPPGEGIPCRLAGTSTPGAEIDGHGTFLERLIAVGEEIGWTPAPEHGVFREKA